MALGNMMKGIVSGGMGNYSEVTPEELTKEYGEYLIAGETKEKDLLSYRKRLDDYAEKMKHYDHTNISNFLKERY